MYKGLYDKFSNWFRGGNIWLYSDPHFSDDEMKFIRKDYIGDEEQIKRINSKVGKNDTIIFLGDIGNVECIKKIRGYKVLIMGNHDKGASNYKRVIEEVETFNSADVTVEDLDKIQELGFNFVNQPDKIKELGLDKYFHKITKDNHLFDEVYEGPLFINDKVLLSHEPLKMPTCIFNIYGHDHSNWFDNGGYGLNVCAEWINYTPVSLLSMLKNGTFSKVDNIHRITIDKATERSNNKKKYTEEELDEILYEATSFGIPEDLRKHNDELLEKDINDIIEEKCNPEEVKLRKDE